MLSAIRTKREAFFGGEDFVFETSFCSCMARGLLDFRLELKEREKQNDNRTSSLCFFN